MAQDKGGIIMNIIEEYFNLCIKDSWTYAKLTKEEKDNLLNLLSKEHIRNSVKGCRQVKREILHSIYEAFLVGCGYNSWNWRDE